LVDVAPLASRYRPILALQTAGRPRSTTVVLTNGVSRLQTNSPNSTCRPYCHGHTLDIIGFNRN
jgi:hypothetical protein